MPNLKSCFLCLVVGLPILSSPPLQALAAEAPAQPATTETASRTIEDGGIGPYKALMASDSTLATHTVFRPKDLAPFGAKEKLPIIAWGNGACANSPWEHVNFLSEIASHGFLIVAIGPMPADGQRGGGGTTKSSLLTDAINWAMAQNTNTTSQYFGKLDTTKIAVSGMSCGGFRTLEVATDLRITTADDLQQRHLWRCWPAAWAACPTSPRTNWKNCTRLLFTFWAAIRTSPTPTAWTISTASPNCRPSLPISMSATAYYIPGPMAAILPSSPPPGFSGS